MVELAPGVGLIPSSAALGDLTWQLVREPDYEERLTRVLAAVGGEVSYDLALVDTPPVWGSGRVSRS